MKVTVYVVVTYYGGHGDEVEVFGTQEEAEARVIKYAKEYWDTARFGRFPRTYDALYDAWDNHDLWGATDSRWELEEREVEVPDREADRTVAAPATRNVRIGPWPTKKALAIGEDGGPERPTGRSALR